VPVLPDLLGGGPTKERMSNFADYEKSAAPREIPVILLDPVA